MNVSCPSCRVIFRVDPARVPLGGVRATCAACGSAIDVPDTDATDWGFPVSLPERPVATGRSSGAARRSSTAAMVNSDRAAVPHVDFDDEEPESGRQSLAPVSRRGAMPPAVPKPRLGTAARRSVPQPVRPPAPAPTAPAPTAEPAVPAPKAAAKPVAVTRKAEPARASVQAAAKEEAKPQERPGMSHAEVLAARERAEA